MCTHTYTHASMKDWKIFVKVYDQKKVSMQNKN